MNLKYKIGASIATAAFLGSILTPTAFAADNKCIISGNGDRSNNRCKILVEKKKIIIKKNFAKVENVIGAYADTGGNNANKNTTNGGDVSIDTGNATVTVTVTNTVNQ